MKEYNYDHYDCSEQKAAKKPGALKLKICALCMASAIIGGFGGAFLKTESMAANTKTDPQAAQTAQYYGVIQTAQSENALTPAQIYSQNADCVVSISTESASLNVFGQVSSSASSGTGFIISADGYIITCYHVVEGAQNITVSDFGGKKYKAELAGYDDRKDLAVLKIDASGLKYVSVGDSNSLAVGQSVYAVGNPLGEYSYSMTSGIVSALDREINIDGSPINMFQLDAAVNPGNSGGPVFNGYGEVIGMVTAKTAMNGVEGIGFAVPIDDIIESANQIMQNGYVSGRPYMGIAASDSRINLRIQNGRIVSEGVEGAYVESVEKGSCADKAGIKQGDIITAVGDKKISSCSDLQTAKKAYSAGDKADITVYRSGSERKLSICFDEQKSKTSN